MKRVKWAYWIKAHITLCALWIFASVHSEEVKYAQVLTLAKPLSVTTTLPYRWDKEQPRQDGTATFRLQMPAVNSKDLDLALYIPRLGNQAQLFILQNGQRSLLTRFGAMTDLDFDAAKAPRWIAVPSVLLQTRQAWQLEIEINAQSGRYGGLSNVHFGTNEQLRPLYEQNYRWRQTSSLLIVVALGILGLLSAGLWWRQRTASFALFTVTAFLGMLRMSDRLIENSLIAWPSWGALMAVAYTWHSLFMIRFTLQTAGVWSAWLLRAFWGLILISALIAVISFSMKWPELWTWVLVSLGLPAIFAIASLIHRVRQPAAHEAILLLICSMVLVAVGLRDFWVVRLAGGESLSFSWMPIALFAFVLAMAWIIVERYSLQVREYRQLNMNLEQKVAERDTRLQKNYELMKAKDQESATLAERARIMRDIHDGVGSQLVGLVSMLKSGQKPSQELHAHALAALDELRMAVDSLQPLAGSLSTVLATLRYRLQPRLQAAGIEIQWDVDELPRLNELTPSAVLQIQRILLEAFTNVIRHSQASIVQVSARHLAAESELPERLMLCVDDNGKSLEPMHAMQTTQSITETDLSGGQGIRNMLWRAQSISANLYIEMSPLGGTRVRLEWPLLE